MNRIKEFRKKLKYTQIKIQMLTGIDQSDYSKFERGIRQPTIEQYKSLALIFNTSIDYLVGLTDNTKRY